MAENSKALDTQIDGAHYKNMKIQPIEFCHVNRLPPCQTAVVKYACRTGSKGGEAGAIKDILKARHYLDLLLQLEYGITPEEAEAQHGDS